MKRTRRILTVLAGLAGFSYSQQVSVSVSLDGDGKNLEYDTTQTFTCKWNSDDMLTKSEINLAEEPLQIRWYYQGNTIYTMEADEYIAYPNFGTTFEQEQRDVSVQANVSISESTLTLTNVKLTDLGDYKCRVSLKSPKNINGKMGYVSGNSEMEGVKVYKTPEIEFTDVNIAFDTRPTQYEAYLASIQPEEVVQTNSTDITDGSIASELSSENSIPEEEVAAAEEDDTESSAAAVISDSRKKRQAEETASPEIEPVQSQETLAQCVVKGAYPEPTSIKIAIGDNEISNLDDSQFVVSNAGKLFDASVTVNAVINGAEQNGQSIKCVVSDSENMYVAEAVSEVLDIQYLPTEVKVVADSSDVFEGDSLTISCESNGNPAPVLTLVHLNDEAINTQINGTSQYKIDKVVKEGDYSFKCVAESDDELYSEFKKESAELPVTVNYLTVPVISVDGFKNQIGDRNIIQVGKEFSLSCEAEASPDANYKWFKVTEGDSPNELAGEENEYKFASAEWKHSGDYYCQAENGRTPKKSKIAKIEVQGDCKVQSISVTAGKIDKNGKQSVSLECVVDQEIQPKCNIEWIYKKTVFKGKAAGSKLTLNSVNDIDSSDLFESQFTCKASNEFSSSGDARVLKGTKIGEKLSAESGGIPWMWIGIGALVLVIAVVVFNKRKNSNEAPEEESQKMNA